MLIPSPSFLYGVAGIVGIIENKKISPRVIATEAALGLIEKLKQKHGPSMFHQLGGCCDGSSPMCYAAGEFLVGEQDVKLGEIGGCPFYIGALQYEYWRFRSCHILLSSRRAHHLFGTNPAEFWTSIN